MSRRDGYAHGVPSWIADAHPDPERATFSVSRVVPR
jgi:hypothetical protein